MRRVPLGEVATINPRGERVDDEARVSFVGMAEIDPVNAVARPLETRTFSEVSKGYTTFRNHDILAAKITPCWENVKIGQAKLDHRVGVGSTEFHVLRPSDRVHDRYLLHFLRQPSVRAAGELRMTGSGGQRRVPVSFLTDLTIQLPSLAEQRRIAAILDHADALRAKRRQVLAHLDSLTQAIFHDMFGAADKHVMIGDIAQSTQYGTSKKAGAVGEWPMLRMGNITYDGRLDTSDLKYVDLSRDEASKYSLRDGDLLFNRTNSADLVGKACVALGVEHATFAGYLIRVRFERTATAHVVAGYLNSRRGKSVLRHMARSIVGQANINAKELKSIRVPVASPHEEALFSSLSAEVRSRRASVLAADARDAELFASLQSRAFRGEL